MKNWIIIKKESYTKNTITENLFYCMSFADNWEVLSADRKNNLCLLFTHSSVLAWGIPGTGEPGGLPSMGSHRAGHDWSDLAAAAAFSFIVLISKSSLWGSEPCIHSTPISFYRLIRIDCKRWIPFCYLCIKRTHFRVFRDWYKYGFLPNLFFNVLSL